MGITCSAMADGGEAEVVVFGTEEDDFTLLFWSLLGTLSISRDNGDEEDAMVAEVDLVLADSTGVTLAGESLVGIWTELLMNITSIIMQKTHRYFVHRMILIDANFFCHSKATV